MDDKKLKEMMLYVAKQSEGDETFGRTKLNKILFYADFLAYAQTGNAISGHRYQKLDKGPAPRKLIPLREELEREGACAEQDRLHYGRPQKRLIALREPDLTRFSGTEIAIVDEVIKALAKKNARGVSLLSHSFIGWEAAQLGEDIPYETVFAWRRPLTESEKRHGLQLEPSDERAAGAAAR